MELVDCHPLVGTVGLRDVTGPEHDRIDAAGGEKRGLGPEAELDWRPYPGKHGESVITRFYQGYILPKKFGFDKRRIHLSRLICSGQMTRDAALTELEAPPYDPEVQALDKEFVVKKFRLTEAEFDRIMEEPPHRHDEYPTDQKTLNALIRGKAAMRKVLGAVRGQVR